MEKQNVSSSLEDNVNFLSVALPLKESFDIIQRDMVIGGKSSAFYFIDGFTKDEPMLKIMDSFFGVKEKDMPKNAIEFTESCLPYVEVDILADMDSVIKNLLSGVTCLFIDGFEECIAIDCRTYPARGVEEPGMDKALRGSRDGFVETIVFNTALIRRRIRDRHLTMEMHEMGSSSRTDIAVCYMSDRVDEKVLEVIKKRLSEVRDEDIKMSQQSLAEALYRRKWFNPFPKYKFTERPDTAAVCLMEGKVVLLVDNSPTALILPTSIFDMIEEANDYYFPPITAYYLKTTRIIIAFLTVFMVPLFLLMLQNPDMVPSDLKFILIDDEIHISPICQILILELALDGLRLAALNTPSMLSTPLSVIAGIVMGEFSVKSGWFNAEIMLYLAFVSVANYSQPNYELGYALKFMRLILLVLTAAFNKIGFITGCLFVLYCIVVNKTLSGRSYMDVRLHKKSCS